MNRSKKRGITKEAMRKRLCRAPVSALEGTPERFGREGFGEHSRALWRQTLRRALASTLEVQQAISGAAGEVHQQTLLFLRAQPIRSGRQERQAPPGQNARAWGRVSIAITPDGARAECLRLATPEAPPLCLALPEQSVQAPSATRAECVARAVCSRPAPTEQNARFRRSQRSVLASGAASAVCSRRALPEQWAMLSPLFPLSLL
ncbi:hypothetical protein DFP73DRAFT_594618 [Morchella snyderi]|nr:hypothetical protein DFP73DRAFT_594618 [Morchella snyderi]